MTSLSNSDIECNVIHSFKPEVKELENEEKTVTAKLQPPCSEEAGIKTTDTVDNKRAKRSDNLFNRAKNFVSKMKSRFVPRRGRRAAPKDPAQKKQGQESGNVLLYSKENYGICVMAIFSEESTKEDRRKIMELLMEISVKKVRQLWRVTIYAHKISQTRLLRSVELLNEVSECCGLRNILEVSGQVEKKQHGETNFSDFREKQSVEKQETFVTSKLKSLCPPPGSQNSQTSKKSPFKTKVKGSNNHLLNLKLEQLDDEETILGAKIMSLCSDAGKERRKTLEDSAESLLNLGKIYLQRGIILNGIEQKMSYIRCAVLVHAAIERFKITGNPDKILMAKQVSQEMSENVLLSCGAQHQANLCSISETIFKLVREKRLEIKKILTEELCRNGENDPNFSSHENLPEKFETILSMANLGKISLVELDKILSPDKEEKERGITEKVREVNENVTAFYKKIMSDVTSECLKFLPPPSCKFSIAGLGSVAREEATLYSDFEHIILLEEGIDEKENYQNVLEYFRWFSVVFQVIVIGFGETIIPSVAVKSLNDSYSEDRRANWFFDNFTPNGISFDAMMPHACKIPIGRQQQTKKRRHTVELIKTPQKMAEYLTQYEKMKNGYHLDDVLRQTCLVYGDSGIYASFVEQRNCILNDDAKENQEIYSDMILKNAVPYVRKMFQIAGIRTFNSKSYFYRPTAVCIAVLARMCKVEGDSSFDILDILHDRRILGPTTWKILRYAFAVACEVRMKLYHEENDQRHAIEVCDIQAIVGRETVGDCATVFQMFQASMKENLVSNGVTKALQTIEERFTEHNPPYAVNRLVDSGYSEEAVTICDRICEDKMNETSTLSAMFFCYECYAKRCSNDKQKFEYLEKAEAVYSKLEMQLQFFDSSDTLLHDLNMAHFYSSLDKWQKAIATYEKYFFKYFDSAQDEYGVGGFMQACFVYFETVRRNLILEKADKKLKTVLWDKSNILDLQLLQRYHRADMALHNRIGNNDIATSSVITDISEEFQSILAEIHEHGRDMIFPTALQLAIVRVQLVVGLCEDALTTFKAALLLHVHRLDLNLFAVEQQYIHTMEKMKQALEESGVTSNKNITITKRHLHVLWGDPSIRVF